MRWMKLLLMMGFAGSSLLLGACAHRNIPGDSYCQVYQQIVVSKGDGQISAPLAVKKRILANELIYRQECKKAAS